MEQTPNNQQNPRTDRQKDTPENNTIEAETLRRAGSIFGLSLTADEAVQAEGFVNEALAALRRRREAFQPAMTLAPALIYRPFGPPEGQAADPLEILHGSRLGAEEQELLFAPLTQQLHLIHRGLVRPRDLVDAAVRRLEAVEPLLHLIVTERFDRARREARALAAGPDRGRDALLWGIAYGAKDLFDTTDVTTTFGAEPYRERQPREDAAVIAKCRDAGAVLTAKLSLGELAMGDMWFGGRTNNPWDPEQGAGGSSAGSAAAVATGAVSFALGTETSGSIITPAMRCGVVGLRPSFGRVARTGAMPLSWSFDKIGSLTRSPRDAALVLSAIAGADPGDPDSVPNHFPTRGDVGILNVPEVGFRIGYLPRWFDGDQDTPEGESPTKRELLNYCSSSQAFSLHEIELPDLPYRDLSYLLLADAAAVFEELTLTDRDDLLSRQDPDGWPNIFRGAHFITAVEYLQLQRFRRECLGILEEIFSSVDMLMAPAYADKGNVLVLTTATGHPSITLPIGFTENDMPDSITLFGKPYGEASLIRAAELISESFNLGGRRPPVV